MSHPHVKDLTDFCWIMKGGKKCPKWTDGAVAPKAIELKLEDQADTVVEGI